MNVFKQFSLFDELSKKDEPIASKCMDMTDASMTLLFDYYDNLNKEKEHKLSNDDICTPMNCVRTMIDYVPNELWNRKNIKVFDPCCGNGNFGAYCKFKTSIDNIWFNELNPIRFANCKKILNPKHINNGDAFHLKGEFLSKWDLIMANPPYSGGGNKNRSLSNQFIEYAIELLNDKGYLCFITPNNWMTYNNDNTTLKKLLTQGSFIVIDNDAKKYFPGIGSSFTIIVWQKGVMDNKTKIYNNYLIKDIQNDVIIPNSLPFIPLYISQNVINILKKTLQKNENNFKYRCDLHNFTKKQLLSDVKNDVFKFSTIHTPKKTRYASIKQDIFDKWIIVVPLSTYFKPYILTNVNVTQSVGYFSFPTKNEAEEYLEKLLQPHFKVVIHLTRYGNFNNIMVLKHLKFDDEIDLSEDEQQEIKKLISKMKY